MCIKLKGELCEACKKQIIFFSLSHITNCRIERHPVRLNMWRLVAIFFFLSRHFKLKPIAIFPHHRHSAASRDSHVDPKMKMKNLTLYLRASWACACTQIGTVGNNILLTRNIIKYWTLGIGIHSLVSCEIYS